MSRCYPGLQLKYFSNQKVIVMDDEKYFTFWYSSLAGKSDYYTKDFQGSPDNIKYKGVAKFEPKMLVWCAISEAGISEPVIAQVRCQIMNAERYVEQYLPKIY